MSIGCGHLLLVSLIAEWTPGHLAFINAGAKLFCFKKLSYKKGGISLEVELDGVAYCDTSVLVVERKQQFRYEDAVDFTMKLSNLK